jgi:hypothetical protein
MSMQSAWAVQEHCCSQFGRLLLFCVISASLKRPAAAVVTTGVVWGQPRGTQTLEGVLQAGKPAATSNK